MIVIRSQKQIDSGTTIYTVGMKDSDGYYTALRDFPYIDQCIRFIHFLNGGNQFDDQAMPVEEVYETEGFVKFIGV